MPASTTAATVAEQAHAARSPSPARGANDGLLREVVGNVRAGLVTLGDWTAFSASATTGVLSSHFKTRELVRCCLEIGLGSVSVVAITGLFIGMVLAVQAYSQFHQIGLDTSLGAVIHLSVVRELGPVLTAVMLAGRMGSAMAAQLGTMKVSEQLDALSCLGIDPVRYLVAPRFVACLLMMPFLTVLADVMGLVGSSAICLRVYQIDPHHYWEHTRTHVHVWDLFVGLVKSVIFGGITVLIACHRGFHCQPGAEGVGKAATQAFVASFVAILALDFVLGLLTNTLQTILFTDPMSAGTGI